MRRAHPIRLTIALVAIVVFGAACGDSASSGATQSVTSDDLLTKIEIPSDWDRLAPFLELAMHPFVHTARHCQHRIAQWLGFQTTPRNSPEQLVFRIHTGCLGVFDMPLAIGTRKQN